jgi:hypothetical protein
MAFMRSRVQLPSAPPKLPSSILIRKNSILAPLLSFHSMSSPNGFIGDPLFCYFEGHDPVSIPWLSFEDLIYLNETMEKDKKEEILGEKSYKDN